MNTFMDIKEDIDKLLPNEEEMTREEKIEYIKKNWEHLSEDSKRFLKLFEINGKEKDNKD